MPPTVDRYITDSWYSVDSLLLSRPTGDRISTDTRPTIDQLSTDTRPPVDRLSTNSQPTLERLSTDNRLTVDGLSIDYRPLYRSTVDRYSGRRSGRHYVDTTYSKHDPIYYWDHITKTRFDLNFHFIMRLIPPETRQRYGMVCHARLNMKWSTIWLIHHFVGN